MSSKESIPETMQVFSPNSDILASSAKEVTFSCAAYGLRIGFEATTALARYLPTPLIPGGQTDDSAAVAPVTFSFRETQSPDGQRLFSIGENGVQVSSSPDVQIAARALESHAHRYVAANAQHVIFVHAGVVSWKEKAILVPGRSHSGKSTMVMSLVDAGATYYSDEYAVLDPEGRVHPFQRLPRLRSDVAKTGSFAMDWANDAARSSLPVGLVLHTKFNPAGVWQPRVLTRGETLLVLLRNTVAVRRQAELSVRALKNAVASAIGLESDRRDAADAAQHILQSINES